MAAKKPDRRLFGTDGIRGLANGPVINPTMLTAIGTAAGYLFRNGEAPTVIIGHDTRLSSYMVRMSLTGGFVGAGMNVISTGPIPTPGIAFLMRSQRVDLGVMVTASHNPYTDNGVKFFEPSGYKISDEVELQIEELVFSDTTNKLAQPAEMGRVKLDETLQAEYAGYLKLTLPKNLNLNGLKIVFDPANGAGYRIGSKLLRDLGATVITIGDEPNGININDACGSTHPEELRIAVIKHKAHLGIGLDGDADRVVLVDEDGQIFSGDQVLAVIATAWHRDGRLRGSGVVGTVMSNLGFGKYLDSLGLELVRTKVGDRHVLEHMRAHGQNIGGEESGHIILSDYATTGDGLLAALQVLAVMKQSNQRASVLRKLFAPTPNTTKNIRLNGGLPPDHPSVQEAIEQVSLGLEGGYAFARPSGTEPLIRVHVQHEDPDQVENYAAQAVHNITQALEAVH